VDRATAPIVGNGDRAPTKVELGQMITLLEDGLRAGALGIGRTDRERNGR
jgi:N-acyl-D-aspartate/D-glutamate deacylase